MSARDHPKHWTARFKGYEWKETFFLEIKHICPLKWMRGLKRIINDLVITNWTKAEVLKNEPRVTFGPEKPSKDIHEGRSSCQKTRDFPQFTSV
ncbi:hypothetical protein AVEN_165871-1 [Araneus ventricosus]|uniref:Uncharacterized protein n=1 Tax=Araneus ventricosus TaxID=182803 RepID=A0A4Y2K4H7_ARAVE|nr:hypothetical protein AVEN_165871-1 [Araneus ventricosus]